VAFKKPGDQLLGDVNTAVRNGDVWAHLDAGLEVVFDRAAAEVDACCPHTYEAGANVANSKLHEAAVVQGT
jgi:hypothetical protein